MGGPGTAREVPVEDEEDRRRPRVRVDLIGDLACPWCYLGLVRLERARAARPGLSARLVWRPFLLDPHLPPEGVERRAYLRWKFGGEEAAARVTARIERSARADGVALALERMARTPNTVAAHRLALAAGRAGRGEAALHGLFRALFAEGRDIGRADELRAVGLAAGLDAATVAAALDGGPADGAAAASAAVLRSDRAQRRLGVTGVPVFVFQGRHAISGAQTPEALCRLLDLAAVTAGLYDPPGVAAAGSGMAGAPPAGPGRGRGAADAAAPGVLTGGPASSPGALRRAAEGDGRDAAAGAALEPATGPRPVGGRS
jgi:predicted DsbA family dithiol-disulfide isomerase